MARRREFTVEDLPLVGGAVALDFVNTTGARRSDAPRERLHEYGDLVLWSQRVELLNQETARELVSRSKDSPLAAEEVLNQAIDLRESLYTVLASVALDSELPPEPLGKLDTWFRRGCAHRHLTVTQGRATWRWEHVTRGKLDAMLWPILGSAERLLTADKGSLKKCGECDWLFIDETKNDSRRWCKKLCADRVRARRYYEKRSSPG